MQNHAAPKGARKSQASSGSKQHVRTSPRTRTEMNNRIQRGYGDVFRELSTR